MKKFLSKAVQVAAAVLLGFSAHADEARPMRIVVITAAGGAGDFMARFVAQRLAAKLGRTVLVENRPGAGGNIATALVAKSPADGNTLLLTSNNHTINPQIFKSAGYDALKDFTPITQLTRGPLVLAVGPASSASTLKEFVDTAKATPASGSYATYGIGGAAHLVGEMLKQSSGADLQHVAFRGAAPAMTDTMGGQVPAVIVSLAAAMPHIQAGKLRPLAITSAKRWASTPTIPTVAESGWKDVVYDQWIGIVAPAGMPAALAASLNRDIVDIVTTQEARDVFAKQGMEPIANTSAEFGDYLAKEYVRMAQIIKTNGITAE